MEDRLLKPGVVPSEPEDQKNTLTPNIKSAVNNISDELFDDPKLNRACEALPQNYNFEIHKTICRIRTIGAKRVALQLPEGITMVATTLCDIIEAFTEADTVIMLDETYIDNSMAASLGVHLLVDYGQSSLISLEEICEARRLPHTPVVRTPSTAPNTPVVITKVRAPRTPAMRTPKSAFFNKPNLQNKKTRRCLMAALNAPYTPVLITKGSVALTPAVLTPKSTPSTSIINTPGSAPLTPVVIAKGTTLHTPVAIAKKSAPQTLVVSTSGMMPLTPAVITKESAPQTPVVSTSGMMPLTPAVITEESALQTPVVSTSGMMPLTPAVITEESAPQTPIVSTSGMMPLTPAVITKESARQTPVVSTSGMMPLTPAVITKERAPQTPVASTSGMMPLTPAVITEESAPQTPVASTSGMLPLTPAVITKERAPQTPVASTSGMMPLTPAVITEESAPQTPVASTSGMMPLTPAVITKERAPQTPVASTSGMLPLTPAVITKESAPQTPVASTTGMMPLTPAVITEESAPQTPVMITIDSSPQTPDISNTRNDSHNILGPPKRKVFSRSAPQTRSVSTSKNEPPTPVLSTRKNESTTRSASLNRQGSPKKKVRFSLSEEPHTPVEVTPRSRRHKANQNSSKNKTRHSLFTTPSTGKLGMPIVSSSDNAAQTLVLNAIKNEPQTPVLGIPKTEPHKPVASTPKGVSSNAKDSLKKKKLCSPIGAPSAPIPAKIVPKNTSQTPVVSSQKTASQKRQGSSKKKKRRSRFARTLPDSGSEGDRSADEEELAPTEEPSNLRLAARRMREYEICCEENELDALDDEAVMFEYVLESFNVTDGDLNASLPSGKYDEVNQLVALAASSPAGGLDCGGGEPIEAAVTSSAVRAGDVSQLFVVATPSPTNQFEDVGQLVENAAPSVSLLDNVGQIIDFAAPSLASRAEDVRQLIVVSALSPTDHTADYVGPQIVVAAPLPVGQTDDVSQLVEIAAPSPASGADSVGQLDEDANPIPVGQADNNYTWSKDFSTFSGQEEIYLRTPGPSYFSNQPEHLFTLFWDLPIVEAIVKETNLYAWQTIAKLSEYDDLSKNIGTWEDTTVDEIYRLFAMLIYMSINYRSKMDEYWMTGVMGMPEFRALMSRNRFQFLLRFLHFVDNDTLNPFVRSNDRKIAKIKPIVKHLNNKFSSLYTPQREVSLDESLLLWKGNLSWVQSIRTKAARVGIKSFDLCEAVSGYTLRSILYTGQGTGSVDGPIDGFEKPTAKVVLELMDGYLDVGHMVVMDNWYNQLDLTRYLKKKKTDVLGTMNRNRKHVPEVIKSAVEKKISRGAQIALHCGDIAMVTWKDVRLVTIISTFHNDEQVQVHERVGGIKPVAITAYNKFMGGVDLRDSKLSMFSLERKRGWKWYMKVFRRFLNISILNAYIMFTKNIAPKPFTLSHRQFRYGVAQGLLGIFKQVRVPKPMAIISDADLRLDGAPDHFPVVTQNCNTNRVECKKRRPRRRCQRCSALGKRKSVQTVCSKCNVALCLGQCYREYHTLKNLATRGFTRK